MDTKGVAVVDPIPSRCSRRWARATSNPVSKQHEEGFADPSDSEKIFADIAGRYDAMNRLMSWGQDRHWRRLAAQALTLRPQARVLDVGVGTGDMALALRRCWPDAVVVGVDATRPMMDVGRSKTTMEAVELAQADALHLPFPDRHFDGVVSAFLLRNVTDVNQVLDEQRRVVGCGGRVACLEMSWPQTPMFGALFRLYFAVLMPWVTGLLTGQPAAYRYLPRSVQRFQTPQQLTEAMAHTGLDDVHCRRLALGTVTLHIGVRT